MGTMKLSTLTILILGSIMMLLSSCKKDETTAPVDTVTFSTADMEGVWSGALRVVYHGGSADGRDTTTNMKMTFGSNGTFVSIEHGPAYISISGNLAVAADGKITGTITTTHKTDAVNVETTSMNWVGSTFATKTRIAVNMNWPWSNTAPGSGYFLITGTLDKQ